MPELPEVETVRRGLEPVMTGAVFTDVEQRRANLRFPFPENFGPRLRGRRIEGLGRRAKYLLGDLDDGTVLVMHLGMSGSFRIADAEGDHSPGGFHYPRGAGGVHDHVVFHLGNGASITYNDPRRFGFMTLIARADLPSHALFKAMGVEPLGNVFDGDLLARLFAGRAAPLKAALLDQRLVAGLGNIYACEALHRAGLDPAQPAGIIATRTGRARPGAHGLARAIRDVLEAAISAGGSTLRDYKHTDGSLGYFQHAFRVYDREGAPCLNAGCRGLVLRIVQSGRSTFFCPVCQT